jgi:hypothetical protein
MEGIIDMTGRTHDHQHARLLHFRTGLGINADTTFRACTIIQNCTYFHLWKNQCVESLDEALYQRSVVPSSLSSFLLGYPLFDNTDEFMQNATCYAERYPELKPQFCPGSNSTIGCQYTNLFEHHKSNVGKSKEWKWGCDDQS